MIRRPRGGPIVVLAAIVGIAAGCATARSIGSVSPSTGPVGQAVELSVFAAASLKDALAAVRTAYEADAPGTTVSIATDSSSSLRTQIEQGAPADVFLSADQQNPRALVDGGLADGDAVAFAGNRLTIIVPRDNPAGISTPADLVKPGVKIVAAGDEVPITTYALQAVGNLADLAGYPADFALGYSANVVSKEENVKAVVAKIELGEGDAAIVYATDAMASSTVKAIEIRSEANVPATYAGVVVKTSPSLAQAHAFLDWLAGPDGVAILGTFGFLPPP
jgi:molybdate transport system substrate-binding protein